MGIQYQSSCTAQFLGKQLLEMPPTGQNARPLPMENTSSAWGYTVFVLMQHRLKTWQRQKFWPVFPLQSGFWFQRHSDSNPCLQSWTSMPALYVQGSVLSEPGERREFPSIHKIYCLWTLLTLSTLLAWELNKFLVLKLATPKLHLPGCEKSQAELIVA